MCASTWVLGTLLHLQSLLKLVGLHAVIAILSMTLIAGLELQAEITVVIFFLILNIKICLPKYCLLLHELGFSLRL